VHYCYLPRENCHKLCVVVLLCFISVSGGGGSLVRVMCAELSVHPNTTLRRWVRKGRIKVVRSSGSRYLISRSEISISLRLRIKEKIVGKSGLLPMLVQARRSGRR